MSSIERLRALALSIRCPFCGESGWCKTVSGKPAASLHSVREWPIYRAYRIGFTQGRDVQREIDQKKAARIA